MNNLIPMKVTMEGKEFLERTCAADKLGGRNREVMYPYGAIEKLQMFFQKYPEQWEILAKMEVKQNGIK